MTTEIKPKWKAFAVRHMLSDWNQNLSAEQVFDLIVLCQEECLEETLDENDIIFWAPFGELDDIASHMEKLAAVAQMTEELI